jgi:succinyl-diaminopimelate desuccinylase
MSKSQKWRLPKYYELLDRIEETALAGLCSKLIQYRTPNPPGDEAEAASYLGSLLESNRFQVKLFPLSPSRASLVARLKGSGELPALLYSGHLDVGSPTDEKWQREPFSGEISGGRVWGRGASDMKGGVAAMVQAALILAAAQLPLRGDLILALTAGEEFGFIGARDIVSHCDLGPVQALFMAEPSDNDVVIAEKGILWLEISTFGKAIHMAQMDQGRNALMMMMPILNGLLQLHFPYTEHPLLGRFLYSINTIQAGRDINTIPDRCTARIDLRTVPGQNHQAIIDQIQQLIEVVRRDSIILDFSASLRTLMDAPPLATPAEHPIIKRFYSIVEEVTGRRPIPQATSAGTDAVAFVPALKVPFLMCGPGNPLMVHHTDEFVEISRLIESTKIYLLSALEFLI